MDIKHLDTRPARPLTSREIAKVISGLLGSLAGWCEPKDICAAMAHFDQHATFYRGQWEALHRMTTEGLQLAPGNAPAAQPGEDS